ncbi:hypothetical protein DLH72_01050 [Candidatus Gracilibacteria bacterium]|nr:MAG: hypothetical protein DLH72_01050 [Candidatus Gracilibacteria bacterium]
MDYITITEIVHTTLEYTKRKWPPDFRVFKTYNDGKNNYVECRIDFGGYGPYTLFFIVIVFLMIIINMVVMMKLLIYKKKEKFLFSKKKNKW